MKIDDEPFALSFGEKDIANLPRLPPGKDDFSTVISHPRITADSFNTLILTDYGSQIRLHFTYTDSYRSNYETVICLSHLASGALAYCPQGNEIK
ncbi:MAG: hypothetical protein JO071_16015 [Deltaproteobacteria bacterium]|nr:hypothetical protein [Deltaproteobacteria bacterium]